MNKLGNVVNVGKGKMSYTGAGLIAGAAGLYMLGPDYEVWSTFVLQLGIALGVVGIRRNMPEKS